MVAVLGERFQGFVAGFRVVEANSLVAKVRRELDHHGSSSFSIGLPKGVLANMADSTVLADVRSKIPEKYLADYDRGFSEERKTPDDKKGPDAKSPEPAGGKAPASEGEKASIQIDWESGLLVVAAGLLAVGAAVSIFGPGTQATTPALTTAAGLTFSAAL